MHVLLPAKFVVHLFSTLSLSFLHVVKMTAKLYMLSLIVVDGSVDFRSVLVLNGNGADVAKHAVPAVPTER